MTMTQRTAVPLSTLNPTAVLRLLLTILALTTLCHVEGLEITTTNNSPEAADSPVVKDKVAVVGLNDRGLQEDVFDNVKSTLWNTYQKGIDSCPCVPEANLPDLTDDLRKVLGEDVIDGYSSYGLGCSKHDRTLPDCDDGCIGGSNIAPAPIDCDRSWCQRNWCWVDPNNCNLLNRRAHFFSTSNLFYSYATCWDMDLFTNNNRLSSLKGRVLKAAFNSNSGGWLGAYGAQYTPAEGSTAQAVAQGGNFKGPVARWSGPVVSFVTEAARSGNFLINITEPPAFLKPHSQLYFNSSSNFDFCVYTAALGYVDFCVAQYTVTDARASTIDWLLLGSQDILLIVKTEEELKGWSKFVEQTQTIFRPFTTYTWMFIIFIVIPMLGGLMVVHELGHAGSAFPKMESIVEVNRGEDKHGEQEVKERKVPLHKHIFRSLYIAYLSVLQQTYSQSVVTYGAMMNLLGISFFILTIIAVYTANLAAILSQKPEIATVESLEEAQSQGLKICAERKTLEIVQSLYPNIANKVFVNDPWYLGGDGLPGFNCPNCRSRHRVFEMIDPLKARTNSSFCDLALAPLEDLEVEQQTGQFCTLGKSSDSIFGQAQTGIPIFEGVSSELISLFLKLKNDGVYDKEVLIARPESQCQVEFRGEGSALSISQLTGIWVVSFGFAFFGLLVTFISPLFKRCKKKSIHSVIGYDQSGNRIKKLERDDSWVNNKTLQTSTTRLFVLGGREPNKDMGALENIYTVALNDMDEDSSRFGDSNNISGNVHLEKEAAPVRGRPDPIDSSFHSENGQNFRYL